MKDYSIINNLLASAQFLFLVGTAHGGTSLTQMLLGLHPNISSFNGNGNGNNEGQFFQHVYPLLNGSLYNWVHNQGMHLTESSALATDASRDAVFKRWRDRWQLSKSLLLEKSPRHIMMTRLLQHWFGHDHTFFVVLLRHPLATMSQLWSPGYHVDDCGGSAIKHWLEMHQILLEDLHYIKRKIIVHFEWLVQGNSQAHFEDLLDAVGVDPKLFPHILIIDNNGQQVSGTNLRDFDTNNSNNPTNGRERREYRGNDEGGVVLDRRIVNAWASLYYKTIYNDANFLVCDKMITKYEPLVNQFGYSLRNISHFSKSPSRLKPLLLPSVAYDNNN